MLGSTLTACQVQLPSRDRHVVDDLARLARGGLPATPSAEAPASPQHPAPVDATPLPQPTPVAPIPEVPPELSSPGAVAAALTAAETTIHAPRVPPAAFHQAAVSEQRADAAVAAHPEWRDAVVAAVPPPLHDAAAADTAAAVQLRKLDMAADELPHWQVTAPPPAADLLRWYHEAEQESGVPWAYFAAINLVETRMGRIHADSIAGAQGPMQFLPDTWQQYGDGGDVHDPHAAILAAGRFLEGAGAPQDIPGALRQYNPSDLYVAAVTAYAQRMLSDPRAFAAYYEWEADATTTQGSFLLPVGYSR